MEENSKTNKTMTKLHMEIDESIDIVDNLKFENNDNDFDILNEYQKSLDDGDKIHQEQLTNTNHDNKPEIVADTQKILKSASSLVSKCQKLLINYADSCHDTAFVSFVSRLKKVKDDLDTIQEDLVKIQPLEKKQEIETNIPVSVFDGINNEEDSNNTHSHTVSKKPLKQENECEEEDPDHYLNDIQATITNNEQLSQEESLISVHHTNAIKSKRVNFKEENYFYVKKEDGIEFTFFKNLEVKLKNCLQKNKSFKNIEVKLENSYEEQLQDIQDGGHTRTRGTRNKIFCKQCEESFRTEEDFEEHQGLCRSLGDPETISTKSKKLKTFKSKQKKKLPSNLTTNPSQVYRCEHCSRVCFTLKRLEKHILKNHTNQKLCPTCGFTTFSAGSLSRHLQIHGEKIHQCKVCDKSFNVKDKLKYHSRIHTGEKPHECKECGAKFRKSPHLLRHMRIHTGEKNYVCNICSRPFNQRSNLTVHMKSHANNTIPLDFTANIKKRKTKKSRKINEKEN